MEKATYNFDQPIDRRGTNSYKWDSLPDVLPMWVADMDFQTAPCITEALQKRVAQGIFGYTLVPDSYFDAVISWFERRHSWHVERDWILYTSGVVPAVSCALKALTMPGEKVLTLTPAYNCFFSSIRNNGCEVLESVLLRKDDSFVVDWDDFENKCADPKTTVFLLCNPHNPSGRVWTKEELATMSAICRRHDVVVVSDEIHCELVMPGYRFTPFAAVSDEALANSVTLNSPSKSFNTAGLQIANIITRNPEWRRRIDRAININEVCDVNPFGVIALLEAYNHGEDWLDALNDYLWENYKALKAFFRERLPQLTVCRLEGTYLVWVDVRALGMTSDAVEALLLDKGKVWINSGTMYGQTAGDGYIRINIACPRERMLEGLRRIATALEH